MFPYLEKLLGLGIEEFEIVDLHNYGKARHLVGIESFPDGVVHKEHPCFGMVDKIMDIARLELVENRHRNSSIGQSSQETHSPVGLIAGTDCDLVTLLETALLEGNVKLGNPARHIPVEQGGTLII